MDATKEAHIREILNLDRFRRSLIRDKGIKDLYYFNREILEKGDYNRQKNIVPHVHGEWTRWLKRSKKPLKMFLVPRNTLKTTFLTVGESLRRIVANRSVRILLTNATEENAVRFLYEIKKNLESNDTLAEYYSDYKIPGGGGYGHGFFDKTCIWKEDRITVLGRHERVREPTVTAVGVGAGLASGHYDFIIGDDLVNEINSTSREICEKVTRWVLRAMSLLEPRHGEIWLTGTRWSHYDLYSYVLDNLKEEFDIFIRTAYNADGSAYYPELLPLEKLEQLKKSEDSYYFSSFYLNDPVDQQSVLVKHEHIHYIGACKCGQTHTMPDRKNCTAFVGIDPAASQKLRADRSAIMVAFMDNQANLWIPAAEAGIWTIYDLIERMFVYDRDYKQDAMVIELLTTSQLLMPQIYEEEIRRNQFLALKTVESRFGKPKEARIRSTLQTRFERDKVFIAPGLLDLEEQLTHYPRSKRDDLLDCLSDISEVCFTPSGETVESLADREPATLAEKMISHLNPTTQPVVYHPYLGDDWG
jgi:hypothetical protein